MSLRLLAFNRGGILADENPAPATFPEGKKRTVFVNIYERNRKARTARLKAHGVKCSVCCFDFGEVYGPMGEGFIHVQHLEELASIAEEYEVDPVEDLIPVCPNCHAMLHKGSLTPDSLKAKIAEQKQNGASGGD